MQAVRMIGRWESHRDADREALLCVCLGPPLPSWDIWTLSVSKPWSDSVRFCGCDHLCRKLSEPYFLDWLALLCTLHCRGTCHFCGFCDASKKHSTPCWCSSGFSRMEVSSSGLLFLLQMDLPIFFCPGRGGKGRRRSRQVGGGVLVYWK